MLCVESDQQYLETPIQRVVLPTTDENSMGLIEIFRVNILGHDITHPRRRRRGAIFHASGDQQVYKRPQILTRHRAIEGICSMKNIEMFLASAFLKKYHLKKFGKFYPKTCS